MPWPKGKNKGCRTGGQVKGRPNKVTQDLRELVRGALAEGGGQAYLVRQADEKPQAFLALLARLIPSEIRADVGSDQPVEIRIVTGFDRGPHVR